jgi:hypothetical protein
MPTDASSSDTPNTFSSSDATPILAPTDTIPTDMHVFIKDEAVYRVGEDEGLLLYVHAVHETDLRAMTFTLIETDYFTGRGYHAIRVSKLLEVSHPQLLSTLSTKVRYWMPYNDNVRADILTKVSEGVSLMEIARMPLYPPLRVIQSWARRHTTFGSSLNETLSSLGQLMHDRALYEAKQASDVDPKATRAFVEVLKWSAMVANPERFNPAKKEEPTQAIVPVIHIHTGVPERAAIDVTPEVGKIEQS